MPETYFDHADNDNSFGYRWANYFCKGPNSKYFRFCGPHRVFVAITQLRIVAQK